jgi:hypothetical protein
LKKSRLIVIAVISVFLALFLALFLVLAGQVVIRDMIFQIPHRVTQSWQTITLTGLGSIRVPAEWNVEERDGVLFITDRPMTYVDYSIFLIGTVRGEGIEPRGIFAEAERGATLLSRGFNNGTDLLLVEYTVNGITREHHQITFNHNLQHALFSYLLLVWDSEIVDEWHAVQIAKTFSPNRDDFDHANAGQLER